MANLKGLYSGSVLCSAIHIPLCELCHSLPLTPAHYGEAHKARQRRLSDSYLRCHRFPLQGEEQGCYFPNLAPRTKKKPCLIFIEPGVADQAASR